MVVTTDKVFAGSIPEIYDRFLVPRVVDPVHQAFEQSRVLDIQAAM